METLKIPSYARQMMGRAEIAGPYLLKIHKYSPTTKAKTLRRECKKLVDWAKRNYADARIEKCPTETIDGDQFAMVFITDPCMKKLEKLVPPKNTEK